VKLSGIFYLLSYVLDLKMTTIPNFMHNVVNGIRGLTIVTTNHLGTALEGLRNIMTSPPAKVVNINICN
jgi:hypothetical protein